MNQVKIKKIIITLLLLVTTGIMLGCNQTKEDEIQDSRDALPVTDPRQSALPDGVLMPEESEENYTDDELKGLSTEQITWGPGNFTDGQGRPEACVALQEQYGRYAAWFLGPDEDAIYLTFDEGYENGYTADILDTLKEKNVQAVFFVTMDYVTKEPELVQRMIDEGHVVGNHTTHHPNMTTLSIEEARREVQELHDYMLEHFNYEMTLFRAPEGAISEQSMAVLKNLGYQNVLWSFAYHDWDPNQQMSEEKALKKASESSHPGAIYLLHAVSKTNAAILGELISTLEGQGYEFGSLEETWK